MKKRIVAVLMAAVALAAVFTLASCQKKTGVGAKIKVGLVTDTGGIDDKSFNQGTWEGIKLFAKENNLKEGTDVKYLQSSADADYVPNLSTFADQKMNLIVAPGFLFEQAMGEVAKKNPKINFLIIDTVVQQPNVVSATFAAEQSSYLVGVAAGLKAKADKKKAVGFVGGMEVPLIKAFEAGYKAGVKSVAPDLTIFSDYTGSFSDAAKGQAVAVKQYGAGAYIIYQAAGSSGNGVIKEAKERSAKNDIRWAIGVDKDQYADGIYSGDKSCILTSAMKRVDVASHDVSVMVRDGKFPGGTTLVFNLANKGVGIPETNPNLSDDITKAVADAASKIASGSIAIPTDPAQVK
jgi:basic membrane protein A and related proteins